MPDPGADRQAILAGVEHGTEPCLALIGCGGTGCNVLAEGVLEIKGPKLAMGSEPKVLDGLEVDHRIRVQPRRLESEAKSVMSSTRLAGTETEAGLVKVLKGSDLAFIIAGLGGDTGGWAAAMAARACKVARCLSLCVVSEPFKVEGQTRAERAREQGRLIMEYADGLLVLPNDMILAEAPKLPIMRAFQVMDSVLARPINLLSKAVGKEDMQALGRCLASSKVFAVDVVEWDRDHAPFALVEQLAASRWLSLGERTASSAILLAEGDLIHDDLVELGQAFDRKAGPVKHLLLARVGEAEGSYRVTAMVGF